MSESRKGSTRQQAFPRCVGEAFFSISNEQLAMEDFRREMLAKAVKAAVSLGFIT
jgi:hypothetical protein